VITSQARKIAKKQKYLSNFHAVTLREVVLTLRYLAPTSEEAESITVTENSSSLFREIIAV
jgi:hypothetical protein